MLKLRHACSMFPSFVSRKHLTEQWTNHRMTLPSGHVMDQGNNPAALPLAPATITMAPINNLGSFCAGAAHHHGWTLLPASNLQQSSTHIAATQHAVPTMGSMISSSYVQLLNENTRAQQVT